MANQLELYGMTPLGGFLLQSKDPLDVRTVVPTYANLTELATNYRIYQGIIVYVQEEGKHYKYTKEGTWEEFGETDATKVEASTVNGNIKVNDTETTVYTHPTTHAASMITGLADVATSGSYTDLKNTPAVVISPGEANNSAVLSGEYEGYTNEALSQVSVALGAASKAGLKGWFYDKVDLTNKKIRITKTQPKEIKVETVSANTTLDQNYSGYAAGDIISIVNNVKYENMAEIKSVSYDVIEFKSLPFDTSSIFKAKKDPIFGAITLDPDPDEFTLYCVEKYDKGNVDLGGGCLAEGVNTLAINIGAHSEGIQTKAYGQYSHTEGFKTEAGYSAHAEGVRGKATGEGSHAEGLDTIAKGQYTHAEGHATEAIADYTHTEGYKVKAKGVRSHAEGDVESAEIASLTYNINGKDVTFDLIETATTADAVVSHREGRNTQAAGRYSHVEGYGSISYGATSHAEGYKNITVGNNSHAEGKWTRANGNSSHSSGIGTTADAEAQTVVGTYNIPDTTAKFVVGVGTEDKQANAFTVGNTAVDGNYFTVGDVKVTEAQLANTLSGQGSTASAVDYDKTVKAVAHRGYSAGAPENTISAFIHAKEQGFNYVECDVSFTKDNVPVLLHDQTIDRTSNGTGKISELNYADIKDLDFGSWFSPKYNGEKIPTLADFLHTCKSLGLYAYIEFAENTPRPGNVAGTPYTKEQVAQVIQLVEDYGMTDNVCYISFNLDNLTYAHEIDPKARLGYCRRYDITDTDTANLVNLRDTNEVFVTAKLAVLTTTGINRLIHNDIPLEVWTIDTPNDVINLPNYVSGVTSNKLLAGKILSTVTQTQNKQGYFNIIRVLTGCYSDKTQTMIKDGAAYEEAFTPEFGYSISNATASVTMGGVNITPSFKNGKLSIAEVTGDIVINITAKALTPTVDIDLTTISDTTLVNKGTGGSSYDAVLNKGTSGNYSANTNGLTLNNHAYANVNYSINANKIFTLVVTGKLVTKNNNVYQRLFRAQNDAPSVFYWDHNKADTSIIYNYMGAKLMGADGGSTLTSHSAFTQTISTQNSLYTITSKFNNFAEHTYIFTNDGTTISLYIDGILCGTQKSAGMAASSYIGLGENNSSTSATYYAAETTFSEFKIFDECITAEDIPGLIANSQSPSGIINKSSGQAVFGKYNKTDTIASLIVGAGSNSNRANAFTAGNDGTNNYITIGNEKLTEDRLIQINNSTGVPSQGLAYSLSADGTYATCTGIGTCTETSIIIAPTYQGKPVTSIGDWAFGNCSSLTSVVIPDSVTTIGEYAFAWCDSLTSVVIPDSVTTIGNSAFYLCRSLTEIVIPDSVTSIGSGAFWNCDSLRSVVIGSGVTSIGGDAFLGDSDLDKIIYEGTVAEFRGKFLTSQTVTEFLKSLGIGSNRNCFAIQCTDAALAYDGTIVSNFKRKVTLDKLREYFRSSTGAGTLVQVCSSNGVIKEALGNNGICVIQDTSGNIGLRAKNVVWSMPTGFRIEWRDYNLVINSYTAEAYYNYVYITDDGGTMAEVKNNEKIEITDSNCSFYILG